MVDVPGGVKPATLHAPHGHAVVHVQPAARGEPDGLQPDLVGARPATGGHQELVALDLAGAEVDGNGAAAVALDTLS